MSDTPQPSKKLIVTNRFSLSMLATDAVFATRTLSLEQAAERVTDALYESQPQIDVRHAIFDQLLVRALNDSRAFGMSFCVRTGDSADQWYKRECVMSSGDILLVVGRPSSYDKNSSAALSAERVTFRELTIELEERVLLAELASVQEPALLTH